MAAMTTMSRESRSVPGRRLATCAAFASLAALGGGAGAGALGGAAPVAAGVAAAAPSWISAGPASGDVVALAAAPGSPGTIYAASAYGFVLRSGDGAATWTRGGRIAPGVDAGLPGFNRIQQLAVDPSQPATVYAATTVGLFRSSDGGAGWTMLPAGSDPVDAVAVAPSNPATVYALTFRGLRRSRDHGASWKLVGRGQLPRSLAGSAGLAVDPADAGKLYAGSDHGLYRSTDSGGHWTAASGPSAPGGLVAQVLVLPDSSVLAVADFPSGGVVLSTDGGVTWRPAYRGLPSFPGSPLSPTAVVRSGSGDFYAYYPDVAAVYRSTRQLRRWRQVSSLAPFSPPDIAFPVLSLAADPGANVIYAGVAGRGVLRSGTAGNGWSPANGGLALQEVQQVLAAPAAGGNGPMVFILARPDRAPAYASEQLLVSPGAAPPTASTWTEIPGVPGIADRISFDPLARAVYAGTDTGMFRSTGGGPWTAADSGLVDSDLVDFAVAAGQSGHLFALVAAPGSCGTVPCHTLTVFATTDGGTTWSERGSTSDADDPAEPAGRLRGRLVLTQTASPTLYLLGAELHASSDGGATFQTLPLPGLAAALAIDPTGPATLYAAVRPGAAAVVYKSLDSGSSWSPAGNGLPAGAQVAALALDPSHPTALYLATDQGVFSTGDGGTTWTASNQGLEGVSVLNLAVIGAGGAGGAPSTVCAGTEGAGVFTLQPNP
jgi:photosystem II stability/assembly factor-like uncharacterized protein